MKLPGIKMGLILPNVTRMLHNLIETYAEPVTIPDTRDMSIDVLASKVQKIIHTDKVITKQRYKHVYVPWDHKKPSEETISIKDALYYLINEAFEADALPWTQVKVIPVHHKIHGQLYYIAVDSEYASEPHDPIPNIIGMKIKPVYENK